LLKNERHFILFPAQVFQAKTPASIPLTLTSISEGQKGHLLCAPQERTLLSVPLRKGHYSVYNQMSIVHYKPIGYSKFLINNNNNNK
jgi:hypothetical protein